LRRFIYTFLYDFIRLSRPTLIIIPLILSVLAIPFTPLSYIVAKLTTGPIDPSLDSLLNNRIEEVVFEVLEYYQGRSAIISSLFPSLITLFFGYTLSRDIVYFKEHIEFTQHLKGVGTYLFSRYLSIASFSILFSAPIQILPYALISGIGFGEVFSMVSYLYLGTISILSILMVVSILTRSPGLSLVTTIFISLASLVMDEPIYLKYGLHTAHMYVLMRTELIRLDLMRMTGEVDIEEYNLIQSSLESLYLYPLLLSIPLLILSYILLRRVSVYEY